MPLRKLNIAALLLGACLLSSCAPARVAQPAGLQRELQWPALPLEPKIQWVRQITNYEDLGLNQGFWKRVWRAIAGEGPKDIVKPYGIYHDAEGRLFVVDTGAAKVHLFDTGAGSYSVIEGLEEAPLRAPIGITGDGKDNVFLTDAGSGAIYRYSIGDNKLYPFSRVTRPTGIAYNRTNGLLYVSDTANHQVVALDLQGKEHFRFGGRGTAPGRFNFPTDLTVDARGQVIVTDAMNARIQTFSPRGTPLATFGQAGDIASTFAKPKGVAVDSEGHIYVSDALFDAVQIFDDSGRLLLNFGESGGKPGQFWMPSGIAIDANDYIYVADTYNKRIQVFRYLK